MIEKIFLKGKELPLSKREIDNQEIVNDFISFNKEYCSSLTLAQQNFLLSLGGLSIEKSCMWFSPFFTKQDYINNLIVDKNCYLGMLTENEKLSLSEFTPHMLIKYLNFKLQLYHIMEETNQRIIYLLQDYINIKGFNIDKFDYLRYLEKNNQHLLLPNEYNHILKSKNAFDLTINDVSLTIKIVNDERFSRDKKMKIIQNLGLQIVFNNIKYALSSPTVQHRLNNEFLLCDFIKNNVHLII